MSESNTYPLEDFIAPKPEEIVAKLGRFALAGPAGIHLVADWDRTLTANGGGRDITSWGVMQHLLPPEDKVIDEELYRKYAPRDKADTITTPELLDWWHQSLEPHVKHKTDLQRLPSAIEEVGMQPRLGAVELFKLCDQQDIPVVILSAGVRAVIEYVTQQHQMHPTAILATRLQTENDRVVGWDEPTLIHNHNKHAMGRSEILPIQRKRPYTILLGDSGRDPDMVKGTDVLRVQVIDEYPHEPVPHLLPGYDMAVTGTLLPVVGLMNWLTTVHV